MSMNDLRVMPPLAPLDMPEQDLDACYADPKAPPARPEEHVTLWRCVVFIPAILATIGFIWFMWDWFGADGITWVEGTLLGLMSFNVFWLCLTVTTVLLGIGSLTQALKRPGHPRPLKVALLMPIYNEVPWYVLGNARSMLEELRARGGRMNTPCSSLAIRGTTLSPVRNRIPSARFRPRCLRGFAFTIADGPRIPTAKLATSRTGFRTGVLTGPPCWCWMPTA